jgi:formylglycine-generating enzyme required for sulfatase activity
MSIDEHVTPWETPPGVVTHSDMVWIPPRTFLMGSNDFYPEEAPVHRVSVDGFWMDRYAVTNEQFASFVTATGYITVAERPLDPNDYPDADPALLLPGSLVFQQPFGPVDLRDPTQWWAYVPGANWRHPYGPDSDIHGCEQRPVTQVAYEDAEAYSTWVGKALPTEAQWELAARGGMEAAIYAWGDTFMPGGRIMANTWHGEFPWQNQHMRRQPHTMPVGSFLPNGYGLYDMAGNVWEWTSDWYRPRHPNDAGPDAKPCCIPHNPRAASRERSYDPAQPHVRIPRKTLKGGSYLCAPNYCLRYRPAARSPEMIETATCHIGFRCVALDPDPQGMSVTLRAGAHETSADDA